MSDALLTEISGKLTQILGALNGGAGKPTTAATPPKAGPADGGAAAPTAAAKAKATAAAAAAEKAKSAATAGPAAGTKAPGGKRTIEQVRDIIRKVATNEGLGKTSAAEVLMDDGGGVTKVTDLKPENYDKVYEACQVLLSGEGSKTEAEAGDDLM